MSSNVQKDTIQKYIITINGTLAEETLQRLAKKMIDICITDNKNAGHH
jgi:hypothetical protein